MEVRWVGSAVGLFRVMLSVRVTWANFRFFLGVFSFVSSVISLLYSRSFVFAFFVVIVRGSVWFCSYRRGLGFFL